MGTGHVMRCIALAQSWKKRGGLVTFITHCPYLHILKRIESEGFFLIQMGKIYPSAQDVKKTLKIIENCLSLESNDLKSHQWIVLDGYHFTSDYQKTITEEGIKLLVIDDYNHLDCYHADIILNQNIGSHHFAYTCSQSTKKLLGTKYVMLRSEFLTNKNIKPISDKAKNILITMGGSDPDNTTLKILKAIDGIDDPDFNFKIIVGPGNPNLESLKKASQTRHEHIYFIENADMPELLSWADLCITAGGSTCWELCFSGVPFLIIIIAENQLNSALRLAEEGAAIILGKKESLIPDETRRCILRTAENIKERQLLKKSGAKLVDGKGAKRIIRQMLVGEMVIRPADGNDAKLLFEWANEKAVRHSSFNPDPIPWEGHLEWLNQKLKDETSQIFIVENSSKDPVGQIRFEKIDGSHKISYSLDEKFRGLGLGKPLLKIGLQTIQTKLQEPSIIQGFVKKNNTASKISFEKCGFVLIKNEDHISKALDCIVYQLELTPKNSLAKT